MVHICKFCNDIRKNSNSLRNHERLCKSNPDGQLIKSNFIEYNKKVKSGLIQKKNSNQFTKAQEQGLPKPTVSKSTRLKISKAMKKRNDNGYWTEDTRRKHSIAMKKAVEENPDSYSASNVSGRVKIYEYKNFKLKGTWELEVAKWLDNHNILWTNKIKPFEYSFKQNIHKYFPDFYLPEYKVYIEVKGYETERDKCKWSVVDNLIVLKQKDINKIKNSAVSPQAYILSKG